MAQGIKEQIGTLPAIEPELHLREVGRKMFGADFVPASDDAPLEQREGRLDSVGVDVRSKSDVLFLPVIDGFVPVVANCSVISGPFIGHDHVHIFGDVLLDVLFQSATLGVLGMEEAHVATTLPDSDNELPLRPSPALAPMPRLTPPT